MDTRPAKHPPAEVLRAFGSGKLDDAAAAAVFSHVEVCAECIQAAARLSGDSFLDRLRAARAHSGTPAPNKPLSYVPASGNTVAIPTTSALPTPVVLPELRDHPQYEVLRELGRGGMGVVYLAKNKLMDRLEVLKVVNKQRFDDPEAAERFLREIRSAARLNHPNIVTAYSALQVGELLLFGMEYVVGQDLAKLVKTRGPLPVGNACYYAEQAAMGLQHAFENGMVHRDIKPQNLIRDGKKRTVKILDFGLAKATRENKGADHGLTGPNIMMGTPDYMAPEQTRDAASVDIRADVYSLGCTLYFLLTGKVPFPTGSLLDKLQGHQREEPAAVEGLRPGLSPALAEVVRRMMAKDPAARYQRPADVAQALAPFFKVGGTVPVVAPVARVVITESVWTRETVAPPPARRETLREASAAVAPLKRETPAKSGKKWLIGAGAGVALLLAGLVVMLAGGVFKVKTADGVLVVQVNEPNPEVYVDGEHVTVSWDDGGKKAEVRVRPGTRKVEVKKDGFTAFDEDVTLEDGGRQPLTAHLEKIPSSNPALKDEAKRAKRMLRWAMKFNTRDGDDYLRQLTGLGAIVAIRNGPDQFMVADLTQRPLRFEQKGQADLKDIQRIWWIDNNPPSVKSLTRAMNYGLPASEVIAFIPEKLEQELAQKELAYNNVLEDQITATTFVVEPAGGFYNVRVVAQTRK